MSTIAANSLPAMLQVYSQKSVDQFVTDFPVTDYFTTDFSDQISNGGQVVVTRYPTTKFPTPPDLTSGWSDTAFTASSLSITLKAGHYQHPFDELQWATITPQILQDVTYPTLVKQLQNGIVVDVLNNVTSSVFTQTVTINSGSLCNKSTLQTGSNYLSVNEAPYQGRMAILTPNAYQGVVASIDYAYIYGNTTALQDYHGIKLAGFGNIFEYPRLNSATPVPGGAKYASNDKLAGALTSKPGLILAMRAPLDVNYGTTFSGTATKNGMSVQVRLVYDVSKPVWRTAAVAIYGSSAGNVNGVIPILSLSTV